MCCMDSGIQPLNQGSGGMSRDFIDIQSMLTEEQFYCFISDNELERGKEQPMIVLREDGMVFVVPAEHRAKKRDLIFSASELWALDRVMEPILDIGCGGGYHLEYLQDKGFQSIMGIDQFACCVRATRRKDIPAESINIFTESDKIKRKFRTILLMSNNLGIGGNMNSAVLLLKKLRELLLPGGEILGITMDWTKSIKDTDRRYYEHQEKKGNPGVLRIRFQYMDQISEWIEVWNASREQLQDVCTSSGLEVSEIQTFSHEQVIAFRLRVST